MGIFIPLSGDSGAEAARVGILAAREPVHQYHLVGGQDVVGGFAQAFCHDAKREIPLGARDTKHAANEQAEQTREVGIGAINDNDLAGADRVKSECNRRFRAEG